MHLGDKLATNPGDSSQFLKFILGSIENLTYFWIPSDAS